MDVLIESDLPRSVETWNVPMGGVVVEYRLELGG
jgi:hypothetical protein